MNFRHLKLSWIFLIILLGLFLRLYNFPNLFHYGVDEELMNLNQKRIVLGEHYSLIGSFSPLNTYLGPIFYYFGAVILWVSGLNPLGQGIFSAFLGGINIFLIYWVCKDLFKDGTKENVFGKRVGLLASLLYATSFLMVIFDRRYWHLTPGPFLSMLVLYSLYKIKSGSIKYIYLLTGALIFGWNTDYTNLVLFLFTFVVWIVFKLPLRRKEVLIAMLIFVISNAPLVMFDLRHDYLNSKAFVSYFTHKPKHKEEVKQSEQTRETLGGTKEEQVFLTSLLPVISFSRAIYTLSDLDISQQHAYCKGYIFSRNEAQGVILPTIALIAILGFAFLTYKNRRDKNKYSYQLILGFFLTFQLGVLIYAGLFKGDVFEHYLATLLPYLFIILAVDLIYILGNKFKIFSYILIVLFVVINISLVFRAYNPFGYSNKLAATKFALDWVPGSQFSLDSLGTCFRYDGYYYPFILSNTHPVKSYQDSNYSWLYDYQVEEKDPGRVIVIVSPSKFDKDEDRRAYQRYQQWVINKQRFGNIEVLILDNSKGDFH
jgi:4-amino-4-deoxy-L-arabinose transferase-like glycosyltransferase